jgi:hypothetical protein
MAFQTTLNRKTRQQKIKASQRQVQHQPAVSSVEPPRSDQTVNSSSPSATENYSYIIGDLKKIGWITAICLLILAISTILISDIGFFVQLRSSFHLPTL